MCQADVTVFDDAEIMSIHSFKNKPKLLFDKYHCARFCSHIQHITTDQLKKNIWDFFSPQLFEDVATLN